MPPPEKEEEEGGEFLETEMRKSRRRLAVALVLLAAIGVAVKQTGAGAYFERGWLQQKAAQFGFAQGFFFFMVLFVVGEVAMVIPMVPPLLTVVATYVFGPLFGGLVGVSGSILVALITFFVTKKLGGDPRILGTLKPDSRFAKALGLVQRQPLLAVSIVRIIPAVGQYPLSNVALALAGVPFREYLLGTCIVNVPIFLSVAFTVELAV